MNLVDSLHNFRKLTFKRTLRQQLTSAEVLLWNKLRNRKLRGIKWRRQANIDKFIADFLCPEHKLIVEVDGGIHESQKEYDALRTEVIAVHGYRVIRFKNEEILKDLPSVLQQISDAAESGKSKV